MIKTGILCFLLVILSGCFVSQATETESQNVITFHTKPLDQGEAWCEMCELIMDRVKVLIQEKDKEGTVNSTLFNLCDIMQGAMRKQCYGMVPMIKDQLTKGFDSHEACLMLEFCGGGQAIQKVMRVISKMREGNGLDAILSELAPILHSLHPRMNQWLQAYSLLKAQSGFSITCMLCKTAVGLLDKTMAQYKQPLVDYVIGICNDLPSPTNKACSDAMGFYIPTWWDAFFNDIASANELCYKIDMCQEPVVKSTSSKPVTK